MIRIANLNLLSIHLDLLVSETRRWPRILRRKALPPGALPTRTIQYLSYHRNLTALASPVQSIGSRVRPTLL